MFGRDLRGRVRSLGLLLAGILLLASCGAPTGLNLAPLPSPTPSRTPVVFTPTPPRALGIAIVARTGGEGVYMRSLPNLAPETRTDHWKDGTQLEIVGDNVEAAGTRWLRVRDPKGGIGYIPADYLITATPTRTPVLTATHTATAAPTATATARPAETVSPSPSPSATRAPSASPTALPPTATRQPVPTAAGPATATPLPTMLPFPTSGPTNTPNPATPRLELLSTTESRGSTFATVEGYVRNIFNSSFENIQVVVEYVNASGQPVSSGTAAIASAFLAPGQSSYFKCLVPVQPGMAAFTVSFFDQAGRLIPSIDRR